MNDVTSRMLQLLTEKFGVKGTEFDLKKELNMMDPVMDRVMTKDEKQYVKEELLKKIRYKESHDGATLMPVSTVTDPKMHEPWYDRWLEEHGHSVDSTYYWTHLEDFLSRELTEKNGPDSAARIVKSIDEATWKIMQQVADPARQHFNYKGLVVGYVQSGKTANFTALIAKAADAGYKLIIVLTGIHNVLRRQTQVRLDRELTGCKDIDSEDNYIAAPGVAKHWNRLTTAHNDFLLTGHDPFETLCGLGTPTLAVVKKRTTVLNKLIKYFSKAPAALIAKVPVLIIDDESDQASIDTNANTEDPDTDPSKTNSCIREILALFPRKTYVGYTATPFANVLIDMGAQNKKLGDDLYPGNFIISLPEPEGYFGTSMIFQGHLSERFVKEIPDETMSLIGQHTMTDHLSEAIDRFIISCAIRNLRGDRTKPMSMLVHVSHKVSDMGVLNELISDYVSNINGRYFRSAHSKLLKNQLNKIYAGFSKDAEAINKGLKISRSLPDFNTIWSEIANVLSVLRIMELNSESDDELDYTKKEEIKVIAIGGNQLSRGLTLEGLMTSYYLRDSMQYDTLLQMGRWFGYRKGYEDLTGIFTTGRIWYFFKHLALVEKELRSEIYRYEEEGKTPMQMALAIRDHTTLTVTAPNKMGASRLRKASFSRSLNQTFWLPLDDPKMLKANLKLGDKFIRQVHMDAGFGKAAYGGVFLSKKKVDGRQIMDFLEKYQLAPGVRDYGPGINQRVLEYIERRMTDRIPELREWAVAVVSNVQDKGRAVDYGGLSINRIGRSRKYTKKGYNIGVLTEPEHLKVDLARGATSPYDGRSPQNPLLILYLISKDSKALQQRENPRPDERVDLFYGIKGKKEDVLGIAIVLPESLQEPNNYIGQ